MQQLSLPECPQVWPRRLLMAHETDEHAEGGHMQAYIQVVPPWLGDVEAFGLASMSLLHQIRAVWAAYSLLSFDRVTEK